MEQHDVTLRIERLERSNRQLRIGLCVMGLALCLLILVAATPKEQFIPVIKTNKMEVTDKTGKTRAALLVDEYDRTILRLVNSAKIPGGVIVMACADGTTGVAFLKKIDDKKKMEGFHIIANDDKLGTGFTVLDSTNKARVRAALEPSDTASVSFFDPIGRRRLYLDLPKDGSGLLGFDGPDEKPRILVSTPNADASSLCIRREDGTLRWCAP